MRDPCRKPDFHAVWYISTSVTTPSSSRWKPRLSEAFALRNIISFASSPAIVHATYVTYYLCLLFCQTPFYQLHEVNENLLEFLVHIGINRMMHGSRTSLSLLLRAADNRITWMSCEVLTKNSCHCLHCKNWPDSKDKNRSQNVASNFDRRSNICSQWGKYW